MSNIVSIPKPKAPIAQDFGDELRRLADAVDRGDVMSGIVVWQTEATTSFLWPSSLNDSLVLAAIGYDQAMERMRT